MISKNDLVLILSDMQENGIDIGDKIVQVLTSRDFPLEILKFINNYRQLDVADFYAHIRKSYNNKKSKLYINIVKEINDVNEVLTTLSSLNLQILLFSKNVKDRQLFLKHSRAEEINKVLTLYYQNYDLTNCLRLLHLIKADIIAFETINGRREEE